MMPPRPAASRTRPAGHAASASPLSGDATLHGLAAILRAEPLVPGLRARSLRPARGIHAGFTHILLLESGMVAISSGDQSHEIEGPAEIVLPPDPDALVTQGPGTAGWLLGMAGPVITDTLGSRAEAELLGPLLRQLVITEGVPPRPDGAHPGNAADDRADALPSGTDLPDPDALAARIRAEIDAPGPGSYLAALACLRLIVIGIWRRGSFQSPAAVRGSEAHLLQAFRRLVELHFRDRLPVADYAAHLGIGYERLHRLCRRNLGRPPLRLIHSRVMREAAAWLEGSGRSIEEIAHSLGFADASEFSHFFKRNSGLAPSAWRTRARNPGAAAHRAPGSFADWP